jgi:hypothetical protein
MFAYVIPVLNSCDVFGMQQNTANHNTLQQKHHNTAQTTTKHNTNTTQQHSTNNNQTTKNARAITSHALTALEQPALLHYRDVRERRHLCLI